MDIVTCGCTKHNGQEIYRGIRADCVRNLVNMTSADHKPLNHFLVTLPDGERLNVDEYMSRYAP